MATSKQIQKAVTARSQAILAFRQTVADVQSACDHPTILERPAASTNYQYIENRYLPAIRVCACCGYIEEARYGWPTSETTDTPLYNTNPKSKSKLNRVDYTIDDDRLRKELIQGTI